MSYFELNIEILRFTVFSTVLVVLGTCQKFLRECREYKKRNRLVYVSYVRCSFIIGLIELIGSCRDGQRISFKSEIALRLSGRTGWFNLWWRFVVNLIFVVCLIVLLLLCVDSCTITVSIIRADKLAAGQRFFNTSSPYLELKIHPPDSVFGDQLQRTSYKPLTMDPEWTPFERFQFTTTNMASREIRVYG